MDEILHYEYHLVEDHFSGVLHDLDFRGQKAVLAPLPYELFCNFKMQKILFYFVLMRNNHIIDNGRNTMEE